MVSALLFQELDDDANATANGSTHESALMVPTWIGIRVLNPDEVANGPPYVSTMMRR